MTETISMYINCKRDFLLNKAIKFMRNTAERTSLWHPFYALFLARRTPAFGWHLLDFLKLPLSKKSACIFVFPPTRLLKAISMMWHD